MRLGVPRRTKRHWKAVEEDLSCIARAGPAQHAHQRRFARAVLAQENVDLAALQLEVDRVERRDARKPLADATHLQQRRRRGRGAHSGRRRDSIIVNWVKERSERRLCFHGDVLPAIEAEVPARTVHRDHQAAGKIRTERRRR